MASMFSKSFISKFNRSSEKVLGVSLVILFVDLISRLAMVLFLVCLGTYVERMVNIDPHLASKYSYPHVPIDTQAVPAKNLMKLVGCMYLGLFTFNHVILHIIGYPSKVILADAYHFLMASTMSALSSLLLVQCLKLWVARPRPDFLSRCYPDGYDVSEWKRTPECVVTLDDFTLNDGLQSFPSGHSTAAWGASVFCFLYLKEHCRAAHSYHSPSRLPRCLPFLVAYTLSIFACYVSCSRMWDFQHHPEDVLAGALIGVVLSYLSFFLYYPLHMDHVEKRQRYRFLYEDVKGSCQPILPPPRRYENIAIAVSAL